MGAFLRHESCDECGSSDGKAVYEGGSSHCFVCKHTVASQEYLDSLDDKPKHRVKSFERKEVMEEVKSTKPPISDEDKEEIKGFTTYAGKGFRGIRDDTYKAFGVRHAFNEEGDVIEQYYPCTQDGQLVGYKIREVPKDFYSKGRTGADVELFMAFKFNRGGKYLVITEGEVDSLSAYQMLNDYNKGKNSPFETAVVSATTGANSYKQIAANYNFIDSFENIILSYDNDPAGQEAIEKLIKVLPKGKIKIMNMRYKDANEYLTKNKVSEFVSDFFSAKPYVPIDIMGSGDLYDCILQQAKVPKVPFPPFMSKLNEMTGQIPLGHIINIAAGTGLGKTSFINEMVYYWVFNSPHKIGIVSMELSAGQYGESLLSRHIGRKLALIKDDDQRINFVASDRIREQAMNLFKEDNGNHRFYLLDNRDGSVEELQDTIEEMVISCGCKIVVLDPLQDVLDGLSNDEQAVFMKWAKGLIKSHGCTLIFINHIRKSSTPGGSSQGGNYVEEEIQGSSTIIKSASFNILLSRDKYNEDPIIRNTTKVMLSKNRITGETGPAGEVYYEKETHTLHDLASYAPVAPQPLNPSGQGAEFGVQ